jgi:pseudouridylate synthase
VITHGLPRPDNLHLAEDMEREIRNEGVTPATIAVQDGKIKIGMSLADLERLAAEPNPLKVSHRDFATALFRKMPGGTTVAGTLFAAHTAGIKVFATGGIGGVHRDVRFDVSTDLQALATTPLIVVCAGAKSILDLPATIEYLETMSVPVVGYQVDSFPAFYTRESGLPITLRLDTEQEVVKFAQTHWGLGFRSAVLVCQPVPADSAFPNAAEIEAHIRTATDEIKAKNIRGKEVTPYELNRINQLTGGKAKRANLALLLNNAALAARIAKAYAALNPPPTA